MGGDNTKPYPFAMMKVWPPTLSLCRKLLSVLCPFSRKKHVDDTGNKMAGDGAVAASDMAPPEQMDVDGTPMATSGDDASTSSDTAMPELMDDLLADIFLRLHLEDGCAALVCKRWHGVISDPYFRNRYKEFHRSRLIELQRLRRLEELLRRGDLMDLHDKRLGIMMVN
ncbi:hypothetical protein ACP70R_014590 [Stipagrostis hirtigluma subsp. patula]